MNRNIPLWASLSLGVVFVFGGYMFVQRTAIPPQTGVIVLQSSVEPQPSISATGTPSDWATYHNTTYGYQIRYPQTWHVSANGLKSQGTEPGIEIIGFKDRSDFEIDISVHQFGTSNSSSEFNVHGTLAMGSRFKDATDLDSFLRLLSRNPSPGRQYVEFTRKGFLNGQPAEWFNVCLRVPDAKTPLCYPLVYAQFGKYLYEISTGLDTDPATANLIMSSLTFDGVPMLAASVTAIPTPSTAPEANVSASTQTDTDNWVTCRNTKYHFEIRFPNDWHTYTHAAGEYIPSSCDEPYFQISNIQPEDGISVTINDLGSNRLTPRERSATTVQAYVQILRQEGATLSSLPDNMDIDGLPTFWFQACPSLTCPSLVFFQHSAQIYQIDIPQSGSDLLYQGVPSPEDVLLFKEILATWRFLN